MTQQTTTPNQPENAALPLLAVIAVVGVFLLVALSTRTPSEASTEAVRSNADTAPAAVVAVEPTAAPVAQVVGYYEDQVARGQEVYGGVCVACHGADLQGVTGLGKNLISSELVLTLSDQELEQFVVKGRQAFDPENTTGVAMPARGGNPALTDAQLFDVIAYIRTKANPLLLIPGNAPAGVTNAQAAPAEAVATEAPAATEALAATVAPPADTVGAINSLLGSSATEAPTEAAADTVGAINSLLGSSATEAPAEATAAGAGYVDPNTDNTLGVLGSLIYPAGSPTPTGSP